MADIGRVTDCLYTYVVVAEMRANGATTCCVCPAAFSPKTIHIRSGKTNRRHCDSNHRRRDWPNQHATIFDRRTADGERERESSSFAGHNQVQNPDNSPQKNYRKQKAMSSYPA